MLYYIYKVTLSFIISKLLYIKGLFARLVEVLPYSPFYQVYQNENVVSNLICNETYYGILKLIAVH